MVYERVKGLWTRARQKVSRRKAYWGRRRISDVGKDVGMKGTAIKMAFYCKCPLIDDADSGDLQGSFLDPFFVVIGPTFVLDLASLAARRHRGFRDLAERLPVKGGDPRNSE